MHAQKLTPGFVVADASYPSLRADPGTLTLQYKDYTGAPVTVVFEHVPAFQWREADRPQLLEGEPYDSVCEIFGSELLREHQDPTLSFGGSVRHIRLNFNAAGALDVKCANFRVQPA